MILITESLLYSYHVHVIELIDVLSIVLDTLNLISFVLTETLRTIKLHPPILIQSYKIHH